MMRPWSSPCRLLAAILLLHRVYAGQVNVTIDDSDPSIMYIPASSWRSSSSSCTQCLIVDTNAAYNETYHAGTHVVIDGDDLTNTTDTDNGGKGKGRGGGGHDRRLDPDDPGFVDTPVTAQIKFNGTAVYVYSIRPVGQAPSPLSPTNMNISFTLDNQLLAPYINPPPSAGEVSQVNVLAMVGLTQSPHVLLVNVGVNSTLLFDYMIYTTESNLATTNTTSSGSSEPTATSTSEKKHNVATFAGAVGGSVGVLSVCAFALFLSICCRRRRAAKRERRERQTDQERMIGPRPFIPRYFPGTVPPPYTPPTASFHSTEEQRQEADLPRYAPQPALASGATYADVPPSSPAPADDDLAIILGITPPVTAPPPFGVATSTPAPHLSTAILTPATEDQNSNFTHDQNPVRSEPVFSPTQLASSDTDLPVTETAPHEHHNEVGGVDAGSGTGTTSVRPPSSRTLTPPLIRLVTASPPQTGR